MLERNMMLPTRKGHSRIAVLAWTYYFMVELLSVISWKSDEWWFMLKDANDGVSHAACGLTSRV